MLVPRYGAVGAAYAALVSFTVLGLVGLFLARHDLGIAWIARFLLQGVLAASTLYVALLFLVDKLPIIPALLGGALLSVIFLGVWQILTKDDVMMVWSWIKRKTA